MAGLAKSGKSRAKHWAKSLLRKSPQGLRDRRWDKYLAQGGRAILRESRDFFANSAVATGSGEKVKACAGCQV